MRSTAILSGLAVLLLAPCVFAQQKQHFRDEQTIATWAKEAVNLLAEKKILLGSPDETFAGNRVVSRGEAVVAIQRLLEQTGKFKSGRSHLQVEVFLAVFAPVTLQTPHPSDEEFKDDVFHGISTFHWGYLAARELAQAGILEGYPDDRFHFQAWLPRAQLAVLISRLLRRLEHAPDLEMNKAVFKDVDGDEWWFGAVLVATGTGVMSGYPDKTFRGSQFVTRNEFAATLARLVALAQLEKATQTPDKKGFPGE